MITAIEKRQDRFINAMNKPWSVERSIIINMKPRRTWESGLTVDKLLSLINSERKRKKKYKKGKIYDAISLINRFGTIDWGIYIATRVGWVDDEKKNTEHRYFNIKEPDETDREKRRLDHKKEIINSKESNVEYHEKVTIPQEQKIAQISR